MHPWLSDFSSSMPVTDQISFMTVSTASTNATADDLPGPGRNLGLLYDLAGKQLERHLGKLAAKLGHDPRSTRTALVVRASQSTNSVSSTSTTATLDNLPGAGRTLGLLQSYTGKRLEQRLGSSAEKFGRGPRLTTLRIIRRSSKFVTIAKASALSPTAVRERYKKLEKDCKRLLNYTGSNSEVTRRQALDHITRLSVSDPYIRGLLNVLGAVQLIDPIHTALRFATPWTDSEATLLSSSRKALISLSDVSVNSISKEIFMVYAAKQPFESNNSPIIDLLLKNLFSYLKDPDLSFLVPRHMLEISQSTISADVFYSINKNLELIVSAMDSSSDNLEWESVDEILHRLLTRLIDKTSLAFDYGHQFVYYGYWSNILERIMRFAFKLPKTIKSEMLIWLKHFDQTENVTELRHALLMLLLLRGIKNANGLADVSGFFYADHALLQTIYSHPDLPLLLRRLACPPEIILFQIVAEPGIDKSVQVSAEQLITHGTITTIQPHVLEQLCKMLVSFIDSKNEFYRNRALRNVKVLLSRDIYSRNAILKAFSDFATSPSYNTFSLKSLQACVPQENAKWSKYKNVEVYRHCDANGAVVHLFKAIGECQMLRLNMNYRDKTSGCHYEDKISWCRDDVLCMRVPPGAALDLTGYGYRAILAGKNKKGEDVYIAWIPGTMLSPKSLNSHLYCAVPEGAKTAVFRDPRGKSWIMDDFYIFLLRYDPTAYSQVLRYKELSRNAEDKTGPYYWERVRNLNAEETRSIAARDPMSQIMSMLRLALTK